MKIAQQIARTTRIVLPSLLLVACWSISAKATEGDVFAKDQSYNTVTYSQHFAICGGKPIDINFANDDGAPLYAPEDGVVEVCASIDPKFGKNIYWISDSGEKLFLAHLKQIDKTGRVYGGQKIGELGNSGSPWWAAGQWWSNSHLHIERCGGELELSGKMVKATTTQGGAGTYTSIGQIKKLIYIWEPGRRLLDEEEYGIGWWPPDVPCVKAEEWVENKQCKAGIDKSICEKAFNILANRYWRWDGTYDGWHKIFFEEFNSSYLQCTAR